jgi:hypothetical protein
MPPRPQGRDSPLPLLLLMLSPRSRGRRPPPPPRVNDLPTVPLRLTLVDVTPTPLLEADAIVHL